LAVAIEQTFGVGFLSWSSSTVLGEHWTQIDIINKVVSNSACLIIGSDRQPVQGLLKPISQLTSAAFESCLSPHYSVRPYLNRGRKNCIPGTQN